MCVFYFFIARSGFFNQKINDNIAPEFELQKDSKLRYYLSKNRYPISYVSSVEILIDSQTIFEKKPYIIRVNTYEKSNSERANSNC